MTTTIAAENRDGTDGAAAGGKPGRGTPRGSWVSRLGFNRFSGLYLLGVFFFFFSLTASNFLLWNGSIEFVLTDSAHRVQARHATSFIAPKH